MTIVRLFSSLLVLAGSVQAATVTIDGSQIYQTIDGFGVNANHRSWTNNELQPVLDALIDQAGMTLFHVIFDNNNWEATNDNSDPNVMNWTYYNTIYSAPEFQKMWGIMGYLNQRGITNGLVPDFEGPVALWMGGLSLTPGYEEEYAETIVSLLVYACNTQHLQFTVMGPVNEPDITYTGINMSGPAQYVTVMHDIAQMLDTNGLSNMRFSGPDLATTSTAWLGTMMNDPVVMAKLAHFGLHSYLGQTPDATGVYSFIQQSAYPNTHFWMTEYNVWCQSCAYDGVGDNSWDYARGTASLLLDLLGEGASAGIVWEGYDSEYVDFNATTGGNDAPHWSCWGLLAVDDTNAVVKTYTPRKGFYTLAQIAKFVRPGAQRIDVSGGSTPLTVLAFYNTNNGQFTVTGVNTNSSATSLSGTLTSLPAIGSLELYYTDSANDLLDSGTVPVNDGSFTAIVPADCVFTLAGSTSAVGPPMITQQPQSQGVMAGSTVLFTATASGVAPLGYQWFFNGSSLTNGGQFNGATSAMLSLSNAQPSNAGGYWVVVTNTAGSVTSIVATLTVNLPGGCLAAPAGLVGWWPGDGNANDIAGTNNGTLQGGATASAVGVVGSAFSFDGTNGYVQIPDAPALKPTNLTVEAWVNFSGLDSALSGNAPAGDQYIVFKQNSLTYYFDGYSLEKFRIANGDAFMFTVGSASGQEVALLSQTLVSPSVWYHVAAVRGSNYMQLYVNGQLEGQTNVSFAQDYGTLPLYFGTSHETYWDGKLKGRLDEVSLYNRALSAGEIAAIYAAGAAGKCKAVVPGAIVLRSPYAQDTNLCFTLAGEAGRSYSLEVSADLAQWSEVETVTLGSDGTALTSMPMTGTRQFYRAKLLP